jgi:hypothetical protein
MRCLAARIEWGTSVQASDAKRSLRVFFIFVLAIEPAVFYSAPD